MGKTKLSGYGAAEYPEIFHQNCAAIELYSGRHYRRQCILVKMDGGSVLDQPEATRPRSELTITRLTSLHFFGESSEANISRAFLEFSTQAQNSCLSVN